MSRTNRSARRSCPSRRRTAHVARQRTARRPGRGPPSPRQALQHVPAASRRCRRAARGARATTPGHRLFADLGALDLEAGGRLPAVRVAYETWGTLNADGYNAVLVLHALTGDSHVTGRGRARAPDRRLVARDGRARAAHRHRPLLRGGAQRARRLPGHHRTVVHRAPDGRPWGGRFPYVTVARPGRRRDRARPTRSASRRGPSSSARPWAGCACSSGRAWAPEAGIEVRNVGAIATTAQTAGDQIAWSHPQLAAIRADPRFRDGDYYDAADGDGPHVGLGIARQIAHTTYRSAHELDQRFGRHPAGRRAPVRAAAGSPCSPTWTTTATSSPAGSTPTPTSCSPSRCSRTTWAATAAASRPRCSQITARTLVVAVDSDRLFPPAQSARLARWIPGAEPLRISRATSATTGSSSRPTSSARWSSEFLG